MKLYHVSEEGNIPLFRPRPPSRADLDPAVGLVWAIDGKRLPNYLTPRDCPRVAYHVCPETTAADRERFFTSRTASHAVIIEGAWLERMAHTTLYLYEFDPAGFTLQDAVAGYYVSREAQRPAAVHVCRDLFGELVRRGVEVRLTDRLWDVAAAVQCSSLNWSLCRMANALPPEKPIEGGGTP